MAKVLKITVELSNLESEPGVAIYSNTIVLDDSRWTTQRERDFPSKLENVINTKISEYLGRFT